MPATTSSRLSDDRPRRREPFRFRPRLLGGIGIDVGSRTIKVARVARQPDGWSLALARIVPVPEEAPVDPETLAEGTVGRLIGLHLPAAVRDGCREAACLLPMSSIQMQTVELPAGSDGELRQMIEVELEPRSPRGCEFDYFENTGFLAGETDLKPYTVFSIESEAAGGLAEGLWDAGLRCERLETLPCALAQAVRLVQLGSTSPVAALDWGASTPTFTLISQGSAVFCRPLRECGLGLFTDLGRSRFGCSVDEFHELLATCWRFEAGKSLEMMAETGTAQSAVAPVGAENLRRELAELAKPSFERLQQELHKTLGYLRQQSADLVPERVWLFGGGALVPDVEQRLTDRTGLETRIWHLPGNDRPDPWQAVFGAACALSLSQCSKWAGSSNSARVVMKTKPAAPRGYPIGGNNLGRASS
jgi:Tfp pilus assembly PilM family ATPase